MVLNPTSGTIPAGECQDMTLTLDAAELAEGIHEGTIDLTSNDPYTPLYQMPVRLDVNQPPVALCADRVVETGIDDCIGFASIDDGSYDPEGGPVTVSQDPPGPYALGDTLATLTVTDETGLTSSCTATVTVVDVIPPAIAVELTPNYLWPPYHQLIDVEAIVVATDNCPDPMVALSSITNSEPDNGQGDGNTVNDIRDADIGMPDFFIKLRAERSALGTGRIYTATYTVMDSSGNMAAAEAYAVVPHDQGGMSDPMVISVAQNDSGTVVSWAEVPDSVHYNVIRGRLEQLRDTGEVYGLGSVYCLESHSLDVSTEGSEDRIAPRPGTGFFYLVEYNDGAPSSYGAETTDKPRTAELGACE
jgi:hypothetical protein